MTRHVGIVGCSAEGAALCYRTICIEGPALLGRYAHPEVSMHTHSLAAYVERIDRDDWRGVGELMLASAEKLQRGGADFLICPDNTIHQALPYIEARSPLPWLHVANVVGAEAVRKGFRTLALTGTRWLIESDVYPAALNAHGIRCVRPDGAEIEEIHRIIMDELVHGRTERASRESLQKIIARLEQQCGCDAVVLGCTELPLIIEEEHSILPTLDSTRLLARAALRYATGAAV